MEDQGEHATDQNSSMEVLRMEEEEEYSKEFSTEDDILGLQSLLFSESDDDVNEDCNSKTNKNLQKKISFRKIKRILGSDSEDDVDMKSSKAKDNCDSDSEIDKKEFKDEENKPSIKLSDNKSSDRHLLDAEVNFKQIKQELGNFNYDKRIRRKNKAKKAGKNSTYPNIKSKTKSKMLKFESNLDTEKNNRENKEILPLVDSESSDTACETYNNISDLDISAKDLHLNENNVEKNSKEDKKSKVVRSSAKKAMDEMQSIQSEQQRLYREAHIRIPYHKPRKHTLYEFLKRRTIIQPQMTSHVGAAIQTKNLKMTSEELEEYAKLMEERAKEANEFFKSESENEEQIFKNNEDALEKPAEINAPNDVNISKQSTYLLNEIEIPECTDTHNNRPDQCTENLGAEELKALLSAKEHMPQVNEEQERPKCSQILITEVIELPKIDMKTVQISPAKTYTSSLASNIRQILAEKKLPESPSLTGDPNKLIDLETGDLIDKKTTGMENLFKRLMSSVKTRKLKNLESCNILSVENGKLEMSKVNIDRKESKDVYKEAKPGAAYFELKRNLKEIIKKRRLEEINKKQEDELEYSQCLADDDATDDDKVEDEIKEIYVQRYEQNDKPKRRVFAVDEGNSLLHEDSCNEEGDADNKDVVEINADEIDAKNLVYEYGQDFDEDEDNEENCDVSKTESVNKSQPKNRIIKAYDDTDDERESENDDIDFLKTQPLNTLPSLNETQTTVKTSLEYEENELMGLCSGTFDETQKARYSAIMSQIPLVQNSGKLENDEELMKLCSGTFDQTSDILQPIQSGEILDILKTKCNKIVSTDEESYENQLNKNKSNNQRVKKFTKKLRKKKAKLGFSDDEDEEECEKFDNQVEEIDDINLEIVPEEVETFVDYDSEENEILVQMTKKDKVKQAEIFFENEAELSESEWGSADEDENNLDKYDFELGDEDEFDREKLQTELGQIHARKMLDADIREVRKIQEMLFEDEETDGVGRQRTFKWKNAESGFSLDDGRSFNENGENYDSGDEINEHQWRKIRYEREQFLKEQGVKPHSQVISTILNNTTIQNNSTAGSTVTTKKLQIITAKKTALSVSEFKKASPFLISKNSSTVHKKNVRGSFLVRDKETLNKLASLTKCTSIGVSDMGDAAGTASIQSTKQKNFVFATLTEEEHENLKRKADELLNSSNENGKNYMKKPRIEPRRDKCFIDQLL